MKIGLYDPYIDILGGGERYIATIAQVLSNKEEVNWFAPNENISQKILDQFNINLDKVDFKSDAAFQKKNTLAKLKLLNTYDIFFYVTDGSLFFSRSSQNFLIIQSPIHCPANNVINNLKLKNWQTICYSKFVADSIKKRLGKKSIILPPAIEYVRYENTNKENLILTVGRFFQYPHNKKQNVLLEVFKSHYKNTLKNYTLLIAGALTEKSGKKYLHSLKEMASGLPVRFIINPKFSELTRVYASAKIYWHAAGFGEDLNKYPERAEHFGITTLEAMQAGCIPLVFSGGGQKEIVQQGENGFLWNTKEELIEKTSKILTDDKLREKISQKAQIRSDYYSKDKFYERLGKIIT